MSDTSVAAALRSPARLVVIEAPAGCGKTFQGAEYAREIAGTIGGGRVLILTHTHAACDVFASRTRGAGGSVDIRTTDSLICQIASAYHLALGLPPDTGAWARGRENGYNELAAMVSGILRASPMIVRSLVQRYPVVICDEHQDASANQHAVALAFYEGGASLRVFGDPVQRIYERRRRRTDVDRDADEKHWEKLKEQADVFDELDDPHRWANGAERLGQWILRARETLRAGGQVDLRGSLPSGLSFIIAENESPKAHGGYRLSGGRGAPIYALEKSTDSLLVLAAHNATVNALRGFFDRRLLIWEGHVRRSLESLVSAVQRAEGNAVSVAEAVIAFLGAVATGFSPSAYGDTLLREVHDGCVTKRRGKPATLQALGRILLGRPDQKGVALVLRRLSELTKTDPAFAAVKVDYHREFWDAVQIGEFDDPNAGYFEISRRRTYIRPFPPAKAISTVHKAKGLECDNVLIMPCDARHFANSEGARCLLYVAMSRAKRSLTIVVSRQEPSPLFVL
jgi:DNA helicase-2/ATP-dependent DNA helicase PcrA